MYFIQQKNVQVFEMVGDIITTTCTLIYTLLIMFVPSALEKRIYIANGFAKLERRLECARGKCNEDNRLADGVRMSLLRLSHAHGYGDAKRLKELFHIEHSF